MVLGYLNVFEISTHQGCILFDKNTVNIEKYYTFKQACSVLMFLHVMHSWCKTEYSASFLQSSVSHNSSEIYEEMYYDPN